MDLDAEPGPSSGLQKKETSFAEEFYSIKYDDFFESASEFDSLGEFFCHQEDNSELEVNKAKKTKQQQKEKASKTKSIKSLEVGATFGLRFKDHPEQEPFLQVKKKYSLHFSTKFLYGSFDIIVRRRFYEDNPILLSENGSAACPFKIMTPYFQTEYRPITFPPDSLISHQGATIRFNKAREVSISFLIASTYVTYNEKQILQMKTHTAKHLELLCLDSSDGSLLGAIYFQTKCSPRKQDQIDPGEDTTEQVEQAPPFKRPRSSSDPLLSELKEINSKLSTLITLLQQRKDN
jgi:hypothetical protein